MSLDEQKRAAAKAAAARIEPGMTVGLGTGSTAAWFVRELAERRLGIRGVATSKSTAELAEGLGISVIDVDDAVRIDLTVDGADEIGPDLALIKGGGGALLREKLVWRASASCLVIADSAKRVEALGKFPLPVEVVGFAHKRTAARIAEVLGSNAPAPVLRRQASGEPFVTDGGHLIYDLRLGRIDVPEGLAGALKAITGVVDHGLFLGLAGAALIGAEDGSVEEIGRD